MASELRWILFALSLPLLAGIWWWTARRSRQAPGNAELRESGPPAGAAAPGWSEHSAEAQAPRVQGAAAHEWGVPPFEPLSIRTADFDPVPTVDAPMSAHSDALDDTFDLALDDPPSARMPESESESAIPTLLVSAAVPLPPPAVPLPPQAEPKKAPPHAPNASELQRIVSVRVCAVGDERWIGADLMAALENHGLAYGRYQVFHRIHSDGRSLFCAASLIEPGTFDIGRMPTAEYQGLALFAVLPGPGEPLHTVDALIEAAHALAQSLHGSVLDAHGVPLSPQHAESLRADVARFQSQLPMA